MLFIDCSERKTIPLFASNQGLITEAVGFPITVENANSEEAS